MTQYNFQKISDEIRETIGLARSSVLDICEIELGDSRLWERTRSKLLRVFGDRGLEGRLIQIIRDNAILFTGHGEGTRHDRNK